MPTAEEVIAERDLIIEKIAHVCYDANATFRELFAGEDADYPFMLPSPFVAGVKWRLANPTLSAAAQHEAWLADKTAAGWVYGPVKDAAKKEHPNIRPYKELSAEEQAKDILFMSIVSALKRLIPD